MVDGKTSGVYNTNQNERTVIVKQLTKNFEVIEKEKGLTGSIRSLFSPAKKTVKALKNISFNIAKGELIGFIGPNGAGKTTALKVLSGLLYPTSGFVQVINFQPWEKKREYLKKISMVMGQKTQLWWDLPAIDTFELNQKIYEIPDTEYEKNLKELIDLLEVGSILKRQVRTLSLGQRMRLELVAALLHRPEVLFLDEPTIGLDVVAQQRMRDFIYEYNRRHKATIILTSHNMDDVVNLTRRVIVIDNGEIFFDGPLRKLVTDYVKEKTITVNLSGQTDIKDFETIGQVKKVKFPEVVLVVPRETAAVASAEILQSFPVSDLTVEEEKLESIIQRVFRRSE
ncbi:ATP-binding cassette domain-containing protein [Candidatus Woesebacteria bacterium]|nr:ATP-binding cassette domain-containing protein [Candidatus Woesebacteria bacterium]